MERARGNTSATVLELDSPRGSLIRACSPAIATYRWWSTPSPDPRGAARLNATLLVIGLLHHLCAKSTARIVSSIASLPLPPPPPHRFRRSHRLLVHFRNHRYLTLAHLIVSPLVAGDQRWRR
uniref:Uncharacterized protein n=1 Tax=Oryza barthii TaxID=65489 RepID=A0A0D3FI32_9ORYZ